MMNAVALGLVLSSMVTAVVWSPDGRSMEGESKRVKSGEKPELVMKEGHRLIVEEFETESLFNAAKKGTHDAYHIPADYAKSTGETIRNAASHSYDKARYSVDDVDRETWNAASEPVHLVRAGADMTKDALKTTAETAKDKASAVLHGAGCVAKIVKEKAANVDDAVVDHVHHTAEKLDETFRCGKDKVVGTMDSVKDAAIGIKDGVKNKYQEATSYLPNLGQGLSPALDMKADTPNAKDQNATLSIGDCIHQAEELLRDAGQKLRKTETETAALRADKLRSLKDEAFQNYRDNHEEKVRENFDSAKQKKSVSGEGLSRSAQALKDEVEGFKESSKEKAGSVYSAAKGNVYDVKERGEKAAAKAGEYLDSVTKGSDEYMKRPAERSVEEASRRKETLAEKMEDVTTAHANERVREALRNAGEAAVEKFREAMDESYRLSSDGAHVLREATRKAEKEFHSLLSEEDTKMQMEGHATTTSEAAMDAAANLSRDLSSKGARHVVWMHKSWSHPEPLRGITRLIHLFCFSTIYGTSIWLTFLAGHVLAAAIPRQQFGWVQSKMYPVYFKTMAYGLAICLVGHTLVHPWLSATKTEKWQTCNLFLSLLFTLLNIFYLEPRATKVMFERLKMEKEEGRGRDVGEINHPLSNNNTSNGAEDANCKMLGLNNRLKVLHRYSSIVNVLSLMCLTWHMAYLSSKINM